jgi:O-Antigen ligase
VRAEAVPVARSRLAVGGSSAGAAVTAIAAFVPILGLAAAQGGYFPTAWGWASIPLLLVVAVGVIVRAEVRLTALEIAFLGALVALAAWTALSAAWSVAPAESLLEVQRTLVYVAALAAALLLSRGRHGRHLLGGVLAAIACISTFSLLTRLVPDRVGVHDRTAVYRLAQPIGYWNGLAIFAGVGVLLAFGFALRARTLLARGVCAGLLVVLLPTFYFTFGRAAWLALAVGVVVAITVDTRRLELLAGLLVLAPAVVAAVLFASQRPALTHLGTPVPVAAHQGHRVLVVVLVLAAVNAVLAVGLAYAGRRIEIGETVRRAFAGAVVAALCVAAIVAFGRYGDPVTLAKRGYTAFKAPPPHAQQDLNRRLLNFSGNGRADLWRLAWDDARAHPVLGAGAGTYERYFLAHEPADVSFVRDAHGLYIEVLGELGPIGLLLILLALAIPFAALSQARRHPLAAVAAGAYAAFLTAAAVDWHWELPAVTLAGLLCGASLFLFARRWRPPQRMPDVARYGIAAAAAAAAVFATVGLLGNTALSRSNSARADGKLERAASDARRARSLLPWSPAPWAALGRAQLAAGLKPQARASFRKAISIDSGDWQLWYDLSTVTRGRTHREALSRVEALYPRSGLSPRVSR